MVFSKGITFVTGQSINSGPIRLEPETSISAILFVEDPTLKKLSTPNGKLTFLQIFGLTNDELMNINSSETELVAFVEKEMARNPLLITDIERK